MSAERKVALGDHPNLFPTPDIVDEEIFHFQRESSVVLRDARVWEMTSDKQSFPQETAGVSVAWGNTTSESDPNISEVQLDAYELSAYSAVRKTTLADARSDIVSWLTSVMAEAAAMEIDNVAFNGDGSATYAGCSGLLSAACGYSVTMGSGSSAFSNLTGDLLSNMIAKLDGLKKQGAKFYAHGQTLHFLRVLKDNNGAPIFYAGSYGVNEPPQIFGYPIVEAIKITGTSAANTAFMVFGNLRYFAIGRRLFTTTLDVDPYGLWTTNRLRFKIYQRWGLSPGLPNAFCRLITAS
jgi:HK97 family phage major capsid protein